MNKKIFKVTSLGKGEDYRFWRKKTPLQRIAALEELRKTVFGYDPSTERLQRVFRVTQLKKH